MPTNTQTQPQPVQIDPTGRLDVLVSGGANMLVNVLGSVFGMPTLGEQCKPLVERLVKEHVSSDPVDISPVGLAERFGILKPERTAPTPRTKAKAVRNVRT